MSLQGIAFTFTLSLAAVAGAPRDAAAQTSNALPAPESIRRAEGFYKEGARRYRAKKFAEAESAFEAAWALSPMVDVAYYLGSAEYMQGKYREAAEHLAFALRAWPLLTVMAGLRPIAEERLAESRTFVGALTINVNAKDAEVLVDGQAVGKAPLGGEVFVEPGTHTVEARLEGFAGAKEAVAIGKGAARVIELKLSIPAPVASNTKMETLSSIAAGAGNEAKGPSTAVLIAGGATAGAALLGGVVFTAIANGKAESADKVMQPILQRYGPNACGPDRAYPGCESLHQAREKEYTFSNLALASFIGAGVLGAGTAIYALAAPKANARATAFVTPQGGAASISWAW